MKLDVVEEYKNCCKLIEEELPNVKCDFTDLKKVKTIIRSLIDKRIIYLNENGINNDDMRDDLILVDLEYYYSLVSGKIYDETVNKK
jgi:hypothetical protein